METLFSDQKFPRPFGVFYTGQRPKYEQLLEEQMNNAITQKGKGDLDALIAGNETWVID